MEARRAKMCQWQSVDGYVHHGFYYQDKTPPSGAAIITTAGILYSYFLLPINGEWKLRLCWHYIVGFLKSLRPLDFAVLGIQITRFSHGAL